MKMINIASTGLQAARAQLEATAMNVSNQKTPGYSRQRVDQNAVAAWKSGGQDAGNGVQIEGISRIADSYLVSQIWEANSRHEYHQGSDKYARQLETVVHGEGGNSGIKGQLTAFVNALSAATQGAQSDVLRDDVITKAGYLAEQINRVNRVIQQQKEGVRQQREAMVHQVNQLSGHIADINKQIVELARTGGNTNALQDQRDELVKNLSSLTEIQVLEARDGSYTVTLNGGMPLVNGHTAHTLALKPEINGVPQLALQVAGREVALDKPLGGALGALNNYQTTTLNKAAEDLNNVAAALATGFNNQLQLGFDVKGNRGAPLFVFDANHPTSILQVATINADQLAFSDKQGEPANNKNLDLLIKVLNNPVNIVGGTSIVVNERTQSMIQTITDTRSTHRHQAEMAKRQLEQAQHQRDELSAVDQDEEGKNLINYQRDYQANLKVIGVANQIFSDLLALLR